MVSGVFPWMRRSIGTSCKLERSRRVNPLLVIQTLSPTVCRFAKPSTFPSLELFITMSRPLGPMEVRFVSPSTSFSS